VEVRRLKIVSLRKSWDHLAFRCRDLPSDITTESLVQRIRALNIEPNLAGLIVQLPLPAHIEKQATLDAIDPRIDVDCITQKNSALFYSSNPLFSPPTALAIMEILGSLPFSLKGKSVVVVGQGDLVGRPITHLLRAQGLEVAVADATTSNLAALTQTADILISGTGHPGLITGLMVKEGSVVIDAGTSESTGGIVGDVDFPSVEKVAGFISPVPGGVGPVTVAKLLQNVVSAAKSASH
jgi:methylenetetrahydrofolate dehydrogenase (NADP+)/methenyltetrahydrofolate cyclohydrolase